MTIVLTAVFLGVPMALALISPISLLYFTLATGALPLTLGREGMLSGALGRMDISAIRVLGTWFAAGFVVALSFELTVKRLMEYRWHVVFLLFCGLALLWAPSVVYGFRMMAKLTAPFLVLLLILVVVSKASQLLVMERWIVISGVVLIAIAVFTRLIGINHDHRLTIPGLGPAVFSAHVATAGVLAFAAAMYRNRIRNMLLVVVFSAAVIAGFTRITIVALFAAYALLGFLVFRGPLKLAFPTGGLVGLAALFLMNDRFKRRMFMGADDVSASTLIDDPAELAGRVSGSGRFEAWQQVLDLFFYPSPLIGSGIGATQNFFYAAHSGGMGVIHSEYIRLLAEVGLVGVIAFAVAACMYFVQLIRTYRTTSDLQVKTYTVAAIGSLLLYLIFMATDNAFDYVNPFGIYVFSLIGMSAKALELVYKQEPSIGEVAPTDHRRYPILTGSVSRP